MDALVNSRVAELEHLRTVALRDLEDARNEIDRLEYKLTRERLDSQRAYRLEDENDRLRERVTELEGKCEFLSVSPVLPDVSVRHQKDLVRQAEEWQDMLGTIAELREDNNGLFERVRRLTKENDDLLKSPLLMARTPRPAPLVESRASGVAPVPPPHVSAPAVFSWLFPLALCGVVLWATWDGSGWITFFWLLVAWNVGRFGPALLLLLLKGTPK